MRYKKAKKLAIEFFEGGIGEVRINMEFGWKFRVYPRLRKCIKLWAKQALKNQTFIKE